MLIAILTHVAFFILGIVAYDEFLERRDNQ